jgi:hypothetical protein
MHLGPDAWVGRDEDVRERFRDDAEAPDARAARWRLSCDRAVSDESA